MDEDMLSLISNDTANPNTEESDSSSATYALPARKCARRGGIVLTKFKGVVPQQNGHWGAQIYANHQRIWLGTFKTEKEAAMAYDSAAIKLRRSDSHKNFPWTDITVEEPNFQNQYSSEAVLNMIKDGSYQSKFEEFLRTRSRAETHNGLNLNLASLQSGGGLICKQLFQKELTPSDVSKLNRLVIPRKYAIKYFPRTSKTAEDNAEGGTMEEDVLLTFHDRLMRPWKFRYCYWKSSQSFVFTRGWNRFVKENNLKSKDTITFYSCDCKEVAKDDQSFYMIDFSRVENSGPLVEQSSQYVGMQLEPTLEVNRQIDHYVKEKKLDEVKELKRPKVTHDKKTGFRLFGVLIV